MEILGALNLSLHFALVLSVLGIIGAVILAGLYEIVRSKVQGLRGQDEIAAETAAATSTN